MIPLTMAVLLGLERRSLPCLFPFDKSALGVLSRLLALRLGVGWHFFKEGAKKFTDVGVPSVAFLALCHRSAGRTC